jgi:hypothetical protein
MNPKPSFARILTMRSGVLTSQIFVLGKHDEADAYVDSITGKKMAANQVSWFIQKVILLPTSIRFLQCLTRLEPSCG